MELLLLSREWRSQVQTGGSKGVSTAKQLVSLFETEKLLISVLADEREELALLAEHVVSTIFEEKVLHDVYENLFSRIVSVLSKCIRPDSPSFHSLLMHKINDCINFVELSSSLDFRRIEMLIHTSVTVLKAISTTETYVCDLITMLVLTLIRLQEEAVSIGKSVSGSGAERSEMSREITASCASLRKKSINSLKTIFISHPQWITLNTATYWNVCIGQFKTPLLFIGGYMTNNSTIVHSIINYIKAGLSNIRQYSISTSKEIVKSIQELADNNCIELVDEDLLGLLLHNCYFNYSESSIAKQKISCTISWKVSIITIFTTLLSMCSSTDGQPKIMLTNHELAASFTTTLVQDLLLLYGFLGYATDATKLSVGIGTGDKKQLSRMSKLKFGTSDEDDLMNLAHALANLIVIYCENCLLDTMHIVVDSQGLLHSLVTVLLTNIQRELVFEDDQAHLCCEIDLLTRLSQLLARTVHGDDIKFIFCNVKSLLALHTTLSIADDCVRDIYGDNVVHVLNKIVLLMKDRHISDCFELLEKDVFMRYSNEELQTLIDKYDKAVV